MQLDPNTFPTRRSSDLKVLGGIGEAIRGISRDTGVSTGDLTTAYYDLVSAGVKTADAQGVLNSAVTLGIGGLGTTDRKSTRLNSSHLVISYAVFCLQKK